MLSNSRGSGSGGANSASVCFSFQRGQCFRGSSCKFSHARGARGVSGRGGRGGRGGRSASRGGRGGRGGRGASRGSSQPPNGNAGVSSGLPAEDTTRLMRLLNSQQGDALVSTIKRYESQWHSCWRNTNTLPSASQTTLLVSLAKLPFSSGIEPPHIRNVSSAVSRSLKALKSSRPDHADRIVAQVDIIVNLVLRLLKMQWESSMREDVKECLESMLSDASALLQVKHADHRKVASKINQLLEQLEQPWTLKTKPFAHANDVDDTDAIELVRPAEDEWRSPTIRWLENGETFQPCSLPVMKVPGSNSGGVYASPEVYFDTLLPLWVAMTFGDGNNVLSPKCKARDGDRECGHVLWVVKDESDRLHCRTKNCRRPVELACCNKFHSAGLCASCARRCKADLLGPPGPSRQPSTHVYDGTVDRISFDGRVFIAGFVSRRPPSVQVHWRTTGRLSSPNLVGIIKIESLGASLRPNDKISWAEIVPHDPRNSRDEDKYRQRGQLAVSLMSGLSDKDPNFQKGDQVAIIDCQTFVPEFMPVLKALEYQRLHPLPFKNGVLLNLGGRNSTGAFNNGLPPDWDAEQTTIAERIRLMVEQSELDPIVQIRRHYDHAKILESQLLSLVKETTLDEKQLQSFLASLAHPVHLTQGPPGTGKSYLGVVIIRALYMIRAIWISVSPSVGRPPILVLSYKNHAIDELLCDLVRSDSAATRSLVRIGSCKVPTLAPFSESSLAFSGDSSIKQSRQKLQRVHNLRLKCRTLEQALSPIDAFRIASDEVANASSDSASKNARKRLYQATMDFETALLRVRLLLGSAGIDLSACGKTSFSVEQRELWKVNVSDKAFSRALDDRADLASLSLGDLGTLYDGVKHYNASIEPAEIIFKWLSGFHPLPQCRFVSKDEQGKSIVCTALAQTISARLCSDHQCGQRLDDDSRCNSAVVVDKFFCHQHACEDADCPDGKFTQTQRFCSNHCCRICLETGDDVVAELAEDDPPRNTCESHPLCCSTFASGELCSNPAAEGIAYCVEHVTMTCRGTTRKGKPCQSSVISRETPYCHAHRAQMPIQEKPASPAVKAAADDRRQCLATTKKGRQCRGDALPADKFCIDHSNKVNKLWSDVNVPVKDELFSAPETGNASATSEGVSPRHHAEEVQQEIVADDVASIEEKADHAGWINVISNYLLPSQPSSMVVPSSSLSDIDDEKFVELSTDLNPAEEMTIIENPTDVVDNGGVDSPDLPSEQETSDVDEPEKATDNPDEIEESAHLQHLRDVFAIEGEDNDVDDDFEVELEQEDEEAEDLSKQEQTHAIALIPSSEWSWDMNHEQRLSSCQSFVDVLQVLLSKASTSLKSLMEATRKEHHDVKVRASARVYEGKSIIGGTIVGCISRLEAIRSTNPFAILIEEASEVLEPLLFACLGSSTCKLELIGDHLQLQPSMMNKFDFEKLNRVNVSMFERLIRAPLGFEVPSTVLSIQRRMRKDVADLTREYYRDIVEIEDHEICSERRIAESSSSPLTRRIPGVESHLFLWTHSGRQQRASVGLSKVNKTESDMVCALASYLVSCGVPKPSIAILTPYKGQLMLIRRELMKPAFRLVEPTYGKSSSRVATSSCVLSTVDRFQGDEADIVIVSLVADANSRSPFVKLVNRMIVLLSRARLGLFIVGNVGYFENRGVEHWKRTLEMLRSPATASDSAGVQTFFDGVRLGEAFPLQCPLHPASRLAAKTPSQVKLGFCQVVCDEKLSCSHPCGLLCHWPKRDHKTSCTVKLESPCSRHSRNISCAAIFANSSYRMVKRELYSPNVIEEALSCYRCDVKVDVQLPCTHEQKFFCFEEKEFSNGSKPFPACLKPALSPYIYPSCKHELACSCSELSKFLADESSVPQCMKNVEYTPATCDHAISVRCYMRQRYDAGTERLQCSKKVTMILPRCAHTATLPCPTAISLASWTGTAIDELDVVRENETYGSKDYNCSKEVTFVRKCGHSTKVKCSRAFDMSRTTNAPCVWMVEITSPECGHLLRVPCHIKAMLEENDLASSPSPLQFVDESDSKSIRPKVALMARARVSQCNHSVQLRRKCGHEETVKCFLARKLPLQSKCEVKVVVPNPLCGHGVSVRCFQRDFDGWTPPVDPLVSSDNVIVEGMELSLSTPFPKLLGSCKQKVMLRQEASCGHALRLECSQAIQIVTSDKKKPKCEVDVRLSLDCGHEQDIACWKSRLPGIVLECTEMVTLKCWNHQFCGSLSVEQPCNRKDTDRVQCHKVLPWRCPADEHTFKLALCAEGFPNACPACSMQSLDAEIKRNDERKHSKSNAEARRLFVEISCSLELPPPVSSALNVLTIQPTVQQLSEFCASSAMLLTKLKVWMNGISLWKRPLFSTHLQPCFVHLTKKLSNLHSFNPQLLMKSFDTMQGIMALEWTANNLRKISGSGGEITLLYGFGLMANTFVAGDNQIPRANKQNKQAKSKMTQWVRDKRSSGFDSVQLNQGGKDISLFWDPFAMLPTHILKLRSSELRDIADSISNRERRLFKPVFIQREFPEGQSSPRQPSVITTSATVVEVFIGTFLSDLLLPSSWDAKSLFGASQVTESMMKDLSNKLQFVPSETTSPSSNPFNGIRLLKKWIEAERDTPPEVHLLLCLEFFQLEQITDAKSSLDNYIEKVHLSLEKQAHPLLLLALARVDDSFDRRICIDTFVDRFPNASAWLIPSESTTSVGGQEGLSQSSSAGDVSSPSSAREIWEELKATHRCKSESMEELLELIGLKKVKVTAVELFRTSIAFMKMSPEIRKANMISFNYDFLGNPGTGKTTVARLLSGILFDSGLRAKKEFIECSAQKLKDDGPDEFRKLVESAKDGVLFIDEAHDLDPVGDFKGKPIVSELLTVAENQRDRISIILAGYEDDMNEKFFKFNDGLKSRFQEVVFEDFDESDLKTLWNAQVERRHWEQGDDRIATTAARRLAKGINTKGFGNAREVRKKVEEATKRAMSRDEFEGELVLSIEDVIGEHPMNNPKIPPLLKEIDEKIGWASIKTKFRELIKICSENYDRELACEPPLSVFLNRMFLGNPGTGKTTCAKLYGRLLKVLNFLSSGEVVVKTASDFVGAVIGESQNKTTQILKASKGKVLVIDEAYNLDDSWYGKQVLDVLVEKVQGSDNDDIAVLLLGYEPQMLEMLRKQNPGLMRRFPPEYAFRFEDYSESELLSIFQLYCRKDNIAASFDVAEKAIRVLSMQKNQANFGNAGSVQQLLKAAVATASSSRKTINHRICLIPSDIESGSDEKEDGDPISLLDKLYGVDNIRQKLVQLRNTLKVSQDEGCGSPRAGNFVFRGAPGTGKTTVARVMSRILYRLGMCGRDHVEETSGSRMTGEFVGHTKKKVEEMLNAANGGVLFIDEAYELGKGRFGEEAMTSLVEAMTDPRYQGLVIIIAGYPADIDQMLNRNSGLKSRFNHYFEFQDWNVDDSARFFNDCARHENFCFDDDLREILLDGLGEIIGLPGWGNGRDVKAIFKSTLSYRANRVVAAPELEKTILAVDLKQALDEMLSARRPRDEAPMTQPSSAIPDDLFPQAPMPMQRKEQYAERQQTQSRIEVIEDETTAEESSAKYGARDAGVTDEEWEELERAKQEHDEKLAQRKRDEEEAERQLAERLAEIEREIQEEKQRLEAIRQAEIERERIAAAAAEKLRQEQAIQQRLRQLSNCPAGFKWFKSGGGWRCGGGSHFVSDEQLKRQFMF